VRATKQASELPFGQVSIRGIECILPWLHQLLILAIQFAPPPQTSTYVGILKQLTFPAGSGPLQMFSGPLKHMATSASAFTFIVDKLKKIKKKGGGGRICRVMSIN
jgi:hypothetical protein